MDGYEIAARALAELEARQAREKADELERLAGDLSRRGGGFTAHAEARLRAEIAGLRERATSLDEALAA